MFSCAIAVTLMFSSSFLWANGRFPAAGQLVVDPTDAAHIVVRATFGLLQSFDRGATWSWICESALSVVGFQDPEILVASGGRIVVGLLDGLAMGDRSGCQWAREPAVGSDDVIDLVGNPADPATNYAVAAVRVEGAFNTRIFATAGGESWSPVGALLPDTYPLTIEVSTARPQRLYLGANNADLTTGRIDVSDDRGASWTINASPAGADAVYVSAVDPQNADRVYVRAFSPQGTLYVSEDGALSWKRIAEATAPFTGFALSPEGLQIAVGGAAGLIILARQDTIDGGGGSSYNVIRTNPSLPVGCLAWTSDGLFACADETTAGFTIGVSRDQGRSFAPLLRLADLSPASCAAGSAVASSCASLWCSTAMTIGASCGARLDAGSDVAFDAGVASGAPGQRSGCSCDVGLAPSWDAGLVILSIVSLVQGRARRRRRGAWTPLRSQRN